MRSAPMLVITPLAVRIVYERPCAFADGAISAMNPTPITTAAMSRRPIAVTAAVCLPRVASATTPAFSQHRDAIEPGRRRLKATTRSARGPDYFLRRRTLMRSVTVVLGLRFAWLCFTNRPVMAERTRVIVVG